MKSQINRAAWLSGLFLVAVLVSCKKNVEDNNPTTGGGNGSVSVSSVSADTLTAHFDLYKAIKKQGKSPGGPAFSEILTNIKDTIRLAGTLPFPVKFFHSNISNNISGAWIQVVSTGGVASSSYYEVPEMPDLGDTTSTIIIGMNPEGLKLPQVFEIKVTVYDKDKKPLAELVRPVKLDKPVVKLPINGGCGPVLPAGMNWEWDMSFTPEFEFHSEPGKLFSKAGVDIEGSCCNGSSAWPQFCVGQLFHNRKLHFDTYYTIHYERFFFYSNGSFGRGTMEDKPIPLPAESDFCAGGKGRVRASLNLTSYSGNWMIEPVNPPVNVNIFTRDVTHKLILITTNSDDVGFGNPGGYIIQMDCEKGVLTLAQVSGEGSGKPLLKCYSAHKTGEKTWYELKVN